MAACPVSKQMRLPSSCLLLLCALDQLLTALTFLWSDLIRPSIVLHHRHDHPNRFRRQWNSSWTEPMPGFHAIRGIKSHPSPYVIQASTLHDEYMYHVYFCFCRTPWRILEPLMIKSFKPWIIRSPRPHYAVKARPEKNVKTFGHR